MQQVQQVQRVQQGNTVAVGERSATRGLCIRPLLHHAPQPRNATKCSKALPGWPPAEYRLPSMDELEALERDAQRQQQYQFRWMIPGEPGWPGGWRNG